jgi:hypothetical protein
MQPTLHNGDLAIVRAQPSYRVGDIVAYHSDSLHTMVLHRIIGRDGERYVFKGDNNTWIDNDHPLASQLVGRMEMTVPGFGNRIQQAASPPGVATLATVAVLPMASKGRRRRKNGTNGKNGPVAEKPKRPARTQPVWRHVDPRLLVASAVALGLLAFAFTKSPTLHTTSDLPFDDRGEFSYTGAATDGGVVYQADKVSSGQPIFLSLVNSVDIGFAYSASSSSPLTTRGDLSLSGEVSDTDGWTYPFTLAATTHFEGDNAHTGGTLNLTDLRTTIDNMQFATGVKHDFLTVLIKASVNRELHRQDASVVGLFSPTLEFKLDADEMHLATPGGNTLTPSQGGLLSLPTQRQNDVSLLGQSLSIALLRAIALGLTLLVAALWIDSLVRMARADESTLIERRYRNYLLPVRAAELATGLVIDVESIAALARLADHTGAPMLRGAGGAYYVVDGNRVYRYSVIAIEAHHVESERHDDAEEPTPVVARPEQRSSVRQRVEGLLDAAVARAVERNGRQ